MTARSRHDEGVETPVQTPLRAQGSLGRTVRAVAWSFIGLRKNSDYQQDTEKLNPLHIVAVGLLAALLLVGLLVALVHWIV